MKKMKHIFTKTIDTQGLKRGISFGLGFILTLATSALVAVSVTGTINSFTSGGVVDATQINTNFTSLKTAVEGITSSQWTTSGSNITYTAGSVGIGTASPTQNFHIHNAVQPVLQMTSASGNFMIGVNNSDIWINSINAIPLEFYVNGSERMRITSTGNVGVGTTTPGVKFEVGASGDGTVARANAWNTFSDERLKKDFEVLSQPLDKISKLTGYYYYWKNGTDKKKQMGIKAGEVEKIFPEIVTTSSDGIRSVDYSKMAAVFIESIKELNTVISLERTKNDKLSLRLRSATEQIAGIERSRNATMQENAELKKRLDRMEMTLSAIERQSSEKVTANAGKR